MLCRSLDVTAAEQEEISGASNKRNRRETAEEPEEPVEAHERGKRSRAAKQASQQRVRGQRPPRPPSVAAATVAAAAAAVAAASSPLCGPLGAFDAARHVAWALEGPAPLCLVLDLPPDHQEDPAQVSQQNDRPKVIAPCFVRFIDQQFKSATRKRNKRRRSTRQRKRDG